MSIPVIDLFAGPGGLGEGFSRSCKARFKIVISIEKDAMARETLRLRAAHRDLARNPSATADDWSEWDSIIESEPWNTVFSQLLRCERARIREACEIADKEALKLELGPEQRDLVSREIRARLKLAGGHLPKNAVLIGGPPCQAFSVVGRSRNRGEKDYVPELDHRHFLYKEYLHVIAEFQPAIFVMENVKGILTSRVDGGRIFQQILSDLRRPGLVEGSGKQVEYVLVPLGGDAAVDAPDPEDFLVKSEDFGVPQARHRVIILGVRKDVYEAARGFGRLQPSQPPTVQQVLDDLPSLRPEISRRGEGMTWIDALYLSEFGNAVRALRSSELPQGRDIAEMMEKCRSELSARQHDPGSGTDRMRLPQSERRKKLRALADWYRDRETNLLANHESRSHMPTDLVRYMFVSAFGKVTGRSPVLADFPRCLLPAHNNVDPEKVSETIFKDRFRVQLASRYSMTVTSHIAKDGHAFIHYKPKQCRSLSVREAARLQTFPDSYVFLGNRTSQYTQVGNAVPPRLAAQIADVVADVLHRADMI